MPPATELGARASVLVAVLAAACLVATSNGTAHGLWQRLGLTIADAWIVGMAAYLVTRPPRAAGPTPEHVSLDGSI